VARQKSRINDSVLYLFFGSSDCVLQKQEVSAGPTLNRLPDAVTGRFEDVAPRDIVVVEHVSISEYLSVPPSEIIRVLFDSDAE